jgi:hypothetical protein
MTLAEFDEASRQLTPAFCTRVAAHMERQRSATTTRNYRPCGRLPTYVATTRGPFSEADGRSRI